MARPRADDRLDPKVASVNQRLAENKQHHDKLVRRWDKAYEAWRGYLDAQSEAAEWTSKQAPMYVHSLVEAVIANQIDPQFSWKVLPDPRMAAVEELEVLRYGAQSHEYLLRDYARCDDFESKQDDYALTNAICGMAVGKIQWVYEKGTKQEQVEREEPVIGDDGEPLMAGLPFMRRPVTATMRSVEEKDHVYRDEPTFENRDPRDFFWPESATSIKTSPWLADRVMMALSDLKKNECTVNKGKFHDGPCSKGGAYHNVNEITKRAPVADSTDRGIREQKIDEVDVTKDLVEVIEMWDREENKVTLIANGKVLLSDRDWPPGYREYPFIVLTTSPDSFKIPGVSLVERAAALQTLLWGLMNQRFDNLKYANNAVMLIRGDMVDDPDEFDLSPGEKIIIEGGPVDEAIKMWAPDATSVQISMPAEAAIRADMQGLTNGGVLSGAASSTLDQTTATGVSIVTSLAQRVVAKQKRRIQLAQQEVGNYWLCLSQIYITEERLIRKIGQDGALAFEAIRPMELQGDYAVEIEASNDSMMRQERRAEAQALMQNALQAAPMFAAVGTPLNMQEFMDFLLEAFDIRDTDRFYSAQPPAMQAGAAPGGGGAPGGGAGEGAGPGGENMGVTAPQSIAPEVSPSNQASMSPIKSLMRALTFRGQGQK